LKGAKKGRPDQDLQPPFILASHTYIIQGTLAVRALTYRLTMAVMHCINQCALESAH